MAIYCNTLEGNMQYGDDPYCFTPSAYLIFIFILLLTIQSDYRQDGQAELICCSIEGEGMHSYLACLFINTIPIDAAIKLKVDFNIYICSSACMLH